jgi:hypothetical protein
MSLKIYIPEVSLKYKNILANYLQTEESDLYTIFNIISGYIQEVEVSATFGEYSLGGAKSLTALIESSTGFKLATIEEFLRFHAEGFSGGDFQHIFLEAYLTIRFNITIAGLPLKK